MGRGFLHRRWRWITVLPAMVGLVLAALSAGSLRAADGLSTKAYALRAAYLYNIAKFVTWPERPGSADLPFRICLVGVDVHASEMANQLKGKRVHERPLEVRAQNFQDPISDCQVLFVGETGAAALHFLLNQASRQAILTVGDRPDFINQGGMLRFYVERQRLRFEIHAVRASGRGLNFSSKLLRLARVVGGPVGGAR